MYMYNLYIYHTYLYVYMYHVYVYECRYVCVYIMYILHTEILSLIFMCFYKLVKTQVLKKLK